MNLPAILLLTAGSSASIAWLTTHLLQPASVSVAVEPTSDRQVEQLQSELAALRQVVRAMQLEGPGRPRQMLASVSAEGAGAENKAGANPAAEAGAGGVVDVTEGAADALEVNARLDAILAAEISSPEATAHWEAAKEAGLLHEVLAAMEERMGDQPETPEKHFDRGRAYYAAARALPSNMDGNWWVDSDDAYSRALELNPGHWDARYQKARNMAFWPVAYGGQAEAMRHFETLVDQQEQTGPSAKFADTYWWLGNLYDQQGRGEDAQAMWKAGAALYPEHESLAKKLKSEGY